MSVLIPRCRSTPIAFEKGMTAIVVPNTSSLAFKVDTGIAAIGTGQVGEILTPHATVRAMPKGQRPPLLTLAWLRPTPNTFG